MKENMKNIFENVKNIFKIFLSKIHIQWIILKLTNLHQNVKISARQNKNQIKTMANWEKDNFHNIM